MDLLCSLFFIQELYSWSASYEVIYLAGWHGCCT